MMGVSMIFGYPSLLIVGETAGQKKPESDNFAVCPHHAWTPTSQLVCRREKALMLSKPLSFCSFYSLNGNLKNQDD